MIMIWGDNGIEKLICSLLALDYKYRLLSRWWILSGIKGVYNDIIMYLCGGKGRDCDWGIMSLSPKPSSHPISNRRDGRAVHSKSGIQKSEHVADAKSLLTIRQAPCRVLWVSWAVSLWHKKAGFNKKVLTNQSEVPRRIWANESGQLCQ